MSNGTTRAEISLIDYLKTVDTPTLSNAIELCKVRPREEGFTPLQIQCIYPELGRMCGYAVTAQVETVTRMEPASTATVMGLFEAVEQSPKPAVVAFQEVGGHADRAAHSGEVMATIFGRLGAIGLVTDCAVRDIPEVKALKFHYFARGKVASHANFRIVRVGIPIQIMGMAIRPGDILHGDENGLLLIPKLETNTLRQAVDEVRSKEGSLMEFVRSTSFTIAGLRERFPPLAH